MTAPAPLSLPLQVRVSLVHCNKLAGFGLVSIAGTASKQRARTHG
jgi:hypothetical protein